MDYRIIFLWGFCSGIIFTFLFFFLGKVINHYITPYFKNKKKKQFSISPRKTFPTYTNNVIQFPTKKQAN